MSLNPIYILFFVNNIQSNNIVHLEIVNYFNNKQKISLSKDIKIYQQKIVLYEGVLNMDKPTKIFFSKITKINLMLTYLHLIGNG